MARVTVAADVAAADLESYQRAVRLLLRHPLITARHPTPAALAQVTRWADQLTTDFRAFLGYGVRITGEHARLTRVFDTLDPTQWLRGGRGADRRFDRRRIAYLCLILASLHRSRVEISLADLVRRLAADAAAIGGLGFDPLLRAHRAAVVDAVDWLAARGALRVSDGSSESWARDPERGDALYDIDHDVCGALFKPARPLQHLASVADLLHAGGRTGEERVDGPARLRQARRALVERPVVYDAEVGPAIAQALRHPAELAAVRRFTGVRAEVRAEGVLLVDSTGDFSDTAFPGRGGAVNRAAGLLLAKFAELREEGWAKERLHWVAHPSGAGAHADLVARIDRAAPAAAEADPGREAPAGAAEAPGGDAAGEVLFVPDHTLAEMVDALYAEFGPESFTDTWRADPAGLRGAALGLLARLRLVEPGPGGVLVLPAAARYRNITQALPGRADGDPQAMLDFHAGPEEDL
ncbi:uncharacterized protein (TIGR02678 family) [Murinocardiopsis flavida]|uniref:Uncharacterized protein (TIGR02678 family) n=1 Tax=Murinocardiopsis flavida TaxID=645275 RepID=A0A2P8DGC8_9ACTN|nr:DUF2398 family protein [Murinocardiopsis flavida]PSK96256.1 uncharacterized protein (TIGR02678 family) [Murinocardiopsis flavida]